MTKPETKTTAILPYIQGITDRIGKLLRRYQIKTVFKAHQKLGQTLVRVKDQLPPLQTAGVYAVPCSCGRNYIGETGRTVEERLREHIRHFKHGNVQCSAVAQHAWETGHDFRFEDTKVLAKEDRWWPRRIKEAMEIARHSQNINGDAGLRLHGAWRSLIKLDTRGPAQPHLPMPSDPGPLQTAPCRPTTCHSLPPDSGPFRAVRSRSAQGRLLQPPPAAGTQPSDWTAGVTNHR